MRPAFLSALLLVVPGMTEAMVAAEADALYARAQEVYATGDHAAALALFDSVATSHGSAALDLAIGNCHFKLNNIPKAILHYERALLQEPGAEDVKANLDLARQRILDRVNELPLFTLGNSWERFWAGHDPDQWTRRSLWAWGTTVLLFILAIALGGTWRSLLLPVAAMAFLVSITSVFLAHRRAHVVRHYNGAIVMAPRVEVASEPREGATTLFMLHAGTKVTVRKTVNTWCEVAIANGSIGWMPATSLERIAPDAQGS